MLNLHNLSFFDKLLWGRGGYMKLFGYSILNFLIVIGVVLGYKKWFGNAFEPSLFIAMSGWIISNFWYIYRNILDKQKEAKKVEPIINIFTDSITIRWSDFYFTYESRDYFKDPMLFHNLDWDRFDIFDIKCINLGFASALKIKYRFRFDLKKIIQLLSERIKDFSDKFSFEQIDEKEMYFQFYDIPILYKLERQIDFLLPQEFKILKVPTIYELMLMTFAESVFYKNEYDTFSFPDLYLEIEYHNVLEDKYYRSFYKIGEFTIGKSITFLDPETDKEEDAGFIKFKYQKIDIKDYKKAISKFKYFD